MSKPKPNTIANVAVIPETGYIRLSGIIGCRHRGIVPILPISRSGLAAWIRDGRLPAPQKLGPKILVWPPK